MLLGVVVVLGELEGVVVGEVVVLVLVLVLDDDWPETCAATVFVSWWKNAMPAAAVPPNATVVIVPSTAPAARAPRMRTFTGIPPDES